MFTVGNIYYHSDHNLYTKSMENAVVQQIRKRITRSKFGEIFFVSSFPQYDVEYVTKLPILAAWHTRKTANTSSSQEATRCTMSMKELLVWSGSSRSPIYRHYKRQDRI